MHGEGLLKADVHVWVENILNDLIKIDASVKIDALIADVKVALDAKIKNLALNLDLGALAHIKALGLIDANIDVKADVKLGLDVAGLIDGVKADVDVKADICIDGLVKLGVNHA